MVAVETAREVSRVDVVSGVETSADSTGNGADIMVSRTVSMRVTVVVSRAVTVTMRGLQLDKTAATARVIDMYSGFM